MNLKLDYVNNFKKASVIIAVSLVLVIMLAACGEDAAESAKNNSINKILTTTATTTKSGNLTPAPRTQSLTPVTTTISNRPMIALTDPCKLLAKEDIESTLGGTISTQKNAERGSVMICSYEIKSDKISNMILSADKYAYSQSDFDATVNSTARVYQTTPKSINGVGEGAYSVGTDFLFVFKNKVSFNLYFPFGANDATTLEKARQLALKAINKM